MIKNITKHNLTFNVDTSESFRNISPITAFRLGLSSFLVVGTKGRGCSATVDSSLQIPDLLLWLVEVSLMVLGVVGVVVT